MIKKSEFFFAAAFAAVLLGCASQPPAPVPPPKDLTSADVPEPFWDFDPTSNLTIDYGDVDAVLATMVVDVGRSDREKLPPMRASTGTRLKTKVRRTTANEGNRFYFEEFEDNEDYIQVLTAVRRNLERIPDQVPLEKFNREEQLAYWLNLYNIALLEQLVAIYPERNLEKELTGKNSILARKILNVSGIPLSLNDIQHTILRWNYDNSPLVLYGLYKGIIGGPNIRKLAYRGPDVYDQLRDNAEEFINSNRGTYWKGGDVFHVSSFYSRNRGYFPDFETDLRGHLMNFIEDPQRRQLQEANRLDADIDDWAITDISTDEPRVAGGFAHNPAAMLGATGSTQPGENPGTSVSTNHTFDTFTAITEDPEFARFKRGKGSQPFTLQSSGATAVISEETTDEEDEETP